MIRAALSPLGRLFVALWLLLPAAACVPGAGLAAQGPVTEGPRGIAGGDLRGPETVLDSILGTPPLNRAHWGVAVYDLATGDTILRHNAHRLFTAASTIKLVTAAAALDLLGPDYRFHTVIEASIDTAGAADSLVIRGGGDPSLGDAFHPEPLAPLDSLADSLAAAGLRRVGRVVVDQSRFDTSLVHPAWETFDLDWYYAAPVAPLAVMGSAFEIVVLPGAPGGVAEVVVPHGPELLELDARIRTVVGDAPWDDVLRRSPDSDLLRLRGTIGAGAGPDTSWIAQTDPGRTAGRAFRRALEESGIQVDGSVRVRAHALGPLANDGTGGQEVGGIEPEGATLGVTALRVTWRSPPLHAIMRVALERSDNWIMEQILKTLSAAHTGRGDWRSGTDLVEQYLRESVGVPTDAVYLRDGSGLTHQGLLTPDAVTTLLRYARQRPWADLFVDALATPGEKESTLDDRLLQYGHRVAAKTGTMRHVNALSGYLVTRGGRNLVFSILSNGSGQPAGEVRPALDRIVESIIESGS